MNVEVEVFLVRIEAGDVLYKKYEADVTAFAQDPDEIVAEYYRRLWGPLSGRSMPVIGERCIVHQTSDHWDAMKRALILTYLLYSEDFFDLVYHAGIRIPFRDVQDLLPQLSKPEVASLEHGILAHALRHLAFLVQTDASGKFEKMLNPQNFSRLSKLSVGLAGRIG